MKNIPKPLPISVLTLLGLTAASASAGDTEIYKNILGSRMMALMILIKEMDVISKIVKCFNESSLLVEGNSKTMKNKAKEQKGGFIASY